MTTTQHQIKLQPRTRGFHVITKEIESQLIDLKDFRIGIANFHLLHTSAGITINENADPNVRLDFEDHFNRLVPEDFQLFRHIDEGLDDMTSHIKTAMVGCNLTIPVTGGKLNLGTWQGIYLCEFRNHPTPRKLVVTLQGELW